MPTKLTRLRLIPTSFYNFFDICVQNNRIIRFSKGFQYATLSMKKFKFDDYITKQSFDLSSELHINKYKILFILNSVPEILDQYRNLAQANCIPIPDPIAISSSVQSSNRNFVQRTESSFIVVFCKPIEKQKMFFNSAKTINSELELTTFILKDSSTSSISSLFQYLYDSVLHLQICPNFVFIYGGYQCIKI